MSLSLILLITFIVATLIYIVYSEVKIPGSKLSKSESIYENLMDDDDEFPVHKQDDEPVKGRRFLDDF